MLIYPYHRASRGAKALKEELLSLGVDVDIAKRESDRPLEGLVLNWGATQIHRRVTGTIINHPVAVYTLSNKLSFFQATEGSGSIPPYYISRRYALEDIQQGHRVVCRTRLSSTRGRGIVIAETPEQLVDAPLYTRYIDKTHEYRVHICNNNIIDIQRKAKRAGLDHYHPIIWNLDGGYVYVRRAVWETAPRAIKVAAFSVWEALAALPYTPVFGAIDVMYDQREDRAYVLEVNSAPGLQGTTVKNYANAVKEYINALSVSR